MLVPNHRADAAVMAAPTTRIVKSIVSQRGMRLAGFVMAWTLRKPALCDGPGEGAMICFTQSGKNGNPVGSRYALWRPPQGPGFKSA
jgi:hypothetical protein